MFPRVRTIRRAWDWFNPLDGCPRCGYAFEREPGYFLMAMWAINCGTGSLLGLVTYCYLELNYELPPYLLLPAVLAPALLSNILFARHAKAYFIALDHLIDPHDKGGGDDRGNQRLDPDPDPTQPCLTVTPVR